MKRSVRLSLKKETLSQLGPNDMRGVGGGAGESGTCYTCFELECHIKIDGHSLDLTNCCEGIPTFHARGLAC